MITTTTASNNDHTAAEKRNVHLWLREEVRPFERRTPLTPSDAGKLIQQGIRVTVERSTQRIYPLEQYVAVGCEVADANAWTRLLNDKTEQPVQKQGHEAAAAVGGGGGGGDDVGGREHVFVLGLKDLPITINIPHHLSQRHIYFAHCYKGQANWKQVLERFEKNAELLDLEFLQYDNGRRVAAFGYSAGFAGMAVGLLQWCQQQNESTGMLGTLDPYESKEKLIAHVQSELDKVGFLLRVMVLGALGRCGRGSVEMARAVGIAPIEWDIEETRSGGPFRAMIEECEILVNDIYLMDKIAPFVTLGTVAQSGPERRLTVFVDVSCDVGNPNNPFPLTDQVTNFHEPAKRVFHPEGGKPLDVVAIDHLPTLIPAESSADFSALLVDHLSHLNEVDWSSVEPTDQSIATTEWQRVWLRARALYANKRLELLEAQL